MTHFGIAGRLLLEMHFLYWTEAQVGLEAFACSSEFFRSRDVIASDDGSILKFDIFIIRERKKGRGKTLPQKRSQQIWPKEHSCQYVQVHIMHPSE